MTPSAAEPTPGEPTPWQREQARRQAALMQKAAQTAYAAVLGVTQGDERAARDEVDKLRLIKSILVSGEPDQSAPYELNGLTPNEQQAVGMAMEAIQASDVVVEQWNQENLQALVQGEPLGEATTWSRLIDMVLPAAWNFDADLYVVFGAFDAPLLKALRQRGQRRVVFVTDVGPQPEMAKDTQLCVTASHETLATFVESCAKPYPKKFARMDLSSEAGEGATAFEAIDAVLNKAIINNWMNTNTRRWFAQRWVEQGIANTPAVARHGSLQAFDGRFKDMPAILIAPGPSLDLNIQQLREAKGKALLIAPLQSLRRLYLEGIQPDFVLVLDATDMSCDPYDFFNDVPDSFLTTLVVAANCHPNVIRRFKSVLFFSSGGPVDHWLEDILSQPLVRYEVPSVALAGLLLAQHWQCNPIILTGHDLALADGKRYAKDAQLTNLSEAKLMTLPGFRGGTVQTPSDYFMFHHHFECIAKEIGALQQAPRLFNCTEGGAFVKGFEHEALSDVMQVHVLPRTRSDVQATVASDAQGEARQRRTRSAIAHFERLLQAIDASQHQAGRCERLAGGGKGGASFLKRLDQEEQALRRLIRQIRGFSIVYQNDIDAALKAASQARSLPQNLAASRQLYAVVSAGCQFLRPLVAQALQTLRADGSPTHETDAERVDLSELV